jgi:uncharacterized protein (DUF2141 family)
VTPKRLLLCCVGLAAGLFFGACATPVAPSGGPPDTTPPILLTSSPEPNAVNFAADRISLVFSERVDRAAFQQSLSFTPEIVLSPVLEWHGEGVDLVLRAPMRDNTTYIMTLDNELKDSRSVAVTRPITLAFSTGPTIDSGRIDGVVRDPSNAAPLGRVDVFAYEEAVGGDAAATRPSYRTQTDSDGSFSFDNLPARPFLVVAVEDINRNQVIDSTEAVGLPSWGVQVPDTGATSSARPSGSLPPWFLGRFDVRSPTVVQLSSLSNRTTEVRFSEAVRIDTLAPDQWVLADTLTSREFEVSELYQPILTPNRVVLLTAELNEGAYEIRRAGVVRDSAGNAAEIVGDGHFSASTRTDTVKTRFAGFYPNSANSSEIDLGRGMHPEIGFNRFVDPAALSTMVTVLDADQQNRNVTFSSANGTAWRLFLEPAAVPGDSVTVQVTGVTPSDTVYAATFVYLSAASTGIVTGTVADSANVIVGIRSATAPVGFEMVTDSAGTFRFSGLMKGNYVLRVFDDRNGDGSWTPGGISPLVLPERLLWYAEPIEVRKGWETDLDLLRFVTP